MREKKRVQKETEGTLLRVRPFRRARRGGIHAYIENMLHPLWAWAQLGKWEVWLRV